MTTTWLPVPSAGARIGAPPPGSVAFERWAEWVGHRLAAEGPAGIEAHLAALAAVAIGRDVAVDVAEVLADRSRPGLVRARAFFAVATALEDVDAQAKKTCATS